MSIKTTDLVNNSDNLQEENKLFGLSNSNKDHNMLSPEFRKKPGYSKIETPKSLYINELVFLGSKGYAY